MPFAVYVLGLGVFCLNTTEIMVAGLIPGMSSDLGVSIAAIGYLVSLFAVGMVVGGPVLIVGLSRVAQKKSLILLLAVFVAGQTLAAMAADYWVLVVARIVTALAASAFFGAAAAVCVRLVGAERRGRAMSVLYGGMMVAQVVGLPTATFIEQHFGWRASFWIVDLLAVGCIAAVVLLVPGGGGAQTLDFRAEIQAFRNLRLWGAYATNALVIGAVVAGFTYLSPIFTDATHFAPATVPVLFAVYGIATVLGNAVVGRFADRYTRRILVGGLIALTLVLVAFALCVSYKVPTIVTTVLLGLIGLPLNPAMAARVMSVSNEGALVNTVNGSAINIGVVLGPWLGGLGISAGLGLVAPLWIGAGMALLGLLTLLPDLRRGAARDPREDAALDQRRGAPGDRPASAPEKRGSIPVGDR
ncbi:MFS transporter [Nocardia brasiliensis]